MLSQELAGISEVEVIEAANPRRGAGIGSSVRNLIADELWLARELPRMARRARADLIHHMLPARARGTRLPQVVTVHDLSFERLPACFDRGFRLYAHHSYRLAAGRADAVICVSQTTAADARELWRLAPERLVVAHHGPGQPLPPPSAVAETAERYFLYVGDDEPRKNVGTMLEGYRRYRSASDRPLSLVLTGSASATDPSIRCEGAPSPQRLSDLYAGAAALLQPSLYEGFGLTALEAMGAGTPVLAARSPGLIEICDGAARMVDPRDPQAWADAMHETGSLPGWRQELVTKGRARAAQFSWEQCARDHVNAYSLALRQG